MQQVFDLLNHLLGLDERSQALGYGQMAARAILMYVALLVIVRTGKKRFLGRATAFDVVLVIMLGSIAARAITGGAPFFVSMIALCALVLIHWIFSAVARSRPSFSRLIKGHSTIVIRNGEVDREALYAVHMSKDDLDEDLREQGVQNANEVVEARLERSGRLSVIKRA